MAETPLTYREAGVDIDAADRALRSVASSIQSTYDDRVLAGIGGFGSLFAAEFPGVARPVLVASIDGVGTKTKVAAMVGRYDWLGHDIVNHCVNDILCQGARPLFFLDYFGCSRLDHDAFEAVVRGAADACADAGCALVGGETAEMPGVYVDEEIDVVGSIVGIVDLDRKLPRGKMQAGDVLIGLASNGLHTNGFSLARKALFETAGYSVREEVAGLGTTIGEELLRPHRCYVKSVWPLLDQIDGIRSVAHITGGGLIGNLPRVMAPDIQVFIDRRSWTPPPIFTLIQDAGKVPDPEMYRTFNMGIGMAIIVDRDLSSAVLQRLHQAGEVAAIIGEAQRGPNDVQIV
ncbi:MAG: Phosphoribosylformylglycinamidine cyclo-ligase [Fimbriimonadaceae bacterium]|nr:Phosphoribosylformylglycinamidine cyclo-ligase [Fimbriimonadaceae bacterium]